MWVVGNGEDLVVRGHDLVLSLNGKITESYEKAFKGTVRGQKLKINSFSSDQQGILRGESVEVCSHNKLYVTGKVRKYGSQSKLMRVKPRFIGAGYSRNDLVLKGSFNSIKLEGLPYDLNGMFKTIEVLGNLYFYGVCDKATAYNGIYLCNIGSAVSA